MLKEWQFDILFFVGVGGALVLLFGPSIGLEAGDNPLTVGGVGAILTYVLTQKNKLTKDKETDDGPG
jgi:hypothetical protein